MMSSSFAQTTAPSSPTTPISLNSILSNITLDEGVGYDIKNQQWTSVSTVKMLEYNQVNNSGKFSGFLNYVGQLDPSVSIGYSTSDKVVVGGSFTLVNPSMLGFNSPLLQYLTIKPFAYYSFYHLGSNLSNIKNSWIFGTYLIQIRA